jgi:predicted outer membrane repeat protein
MTIGVHRRLAWIVGPASLTASVATIGTPLAHAAELTVCAQACEFSRIQDAVDFAHHGDLIKIGPGAYYENIYVNKSLTLSGAGRDKTRVDGKLAGPVITLDSPPGAAADVPIVITNVTITHGRGLGIGGGVEVMGQARLEMHSCILISNRSDGSGNGAGGGINVESFTNVPNRITDTLLVYNHSQSGGGGLAVSFESVVDIIRSTISRNDTAAFGGGIRLLSKSIAKIDNTSITENRSKLGGGGVAGSSGAPLNPGASVTISDSVIADNATSQNGGGILGPADLVSNTVIARNRATIDGGGWLATGFPDLKNVFIVQNTAGHDGGGILTGGQLILSATTLGQNHPNNCAEESPYGSGCP